MSGNTQAVIQVFYCYAPADKYLLTGLEKQLSPLKHINAIAGWSDREILAGTHRDQIVRSYLDYSDLILLLMSPDFLSVDFCYSLEMRHALDRHAKGEAVILPIILRPVMWGITEIRHLQALPKNNKPVTTWSNRDAAFYDVAVGITEVVKKLVENHHKRFVEKYMADAESEARLNSLSWIPTDPFRAEKHADAEDLYKNIYDKLKSVQMEIIQQGLILQQYIDSMVQDETDPEEGELSIHVMEQAFAQEPSSVSEEHESSSERRPQQARNLMHTPSSLAVQRLTESKASFPWPGASERLVVEEMLRDRISQHWEECEKFVKQWVYARAKTISNHSQEEIIQEAMHSITKYLSDFHFQCTLKSWLIPIIEYCIIDTYQQMHNEGLLDVSLSVSLNESDWEGEVFTPPAGESHDQLVPVGEREIIRESIMISPEPNLLLRGARQRKQLTRDVLAGHLGVNGYTVGRWERGEMWPDEIMITKLCQVLQLTATELGFEVGAPPLPPAVSMINEAKSVEDVIVTNEELRGALAALSEYLTLHANTTRNRDITMMVILEGHTHVETTKALGCDPRVVAYVVREAQRYAREKMG